MGKRKKRVFINEEVEVAGVGWGVGRRVEMLLILNQV